MTVAFVQLHSISPPGCLMVSIKIKSNFRRKLHISLWLIPWSPGKCVYKPISGSYLRLFQNTSQISSWCHLDGCVVNTTLFAAVLLHSMNWIALKLATDPYKDPAQSLRWIMRGRGQYQGIIEASGVDIKICVTRTHCRIMSHKKGRLTLKYCDAEWKVTAGSFVLEWMTKVCSSIKY